MDKLLTIGCVAAGGGLGAMLRFVLTGTIHRLVHRLTPREINPDLFLWTGTLLVNVLGCFCIGVLMTLFISHGQVTSNQQRFLITGLLGSLTTFSAFGYETVELFSRENMTGMAFLNVAANLLLGFTAVWLGQLVVRYLLGQ